MEEKIVPRPEKLMIHRYLKLRAVTAYIARALGFLALFWSTVVLLGGFVHDLPAKEFRLLTVLTFMLSLRMMEIFVIESKVGTRGILVDERTIIRMIREQEWIKEHKTTIIVLRTMQLVKWIFGVCVVCHYLFSPFVSLGVSVWRLARRDYGDAVGDINDRAKLNAALDIFYALVLLQSLFNLYYSVIYSGEDNMRLLKNKHSGLEEDWGYQAVVSYYSKTSRKFKKDGKLPCNWDLITYAVGLLRSASEDDHRWGARVLDKLFDKDASVRQKLLSSRISIQNLIHMMGQRGTTGNIESRERAISIMAHLATDVNIADFPGAVQCICSLLETSSCKQYFEPQVTCRPSENPQKRCPDKKDQHRSLETSQHKDDAYMAVPIEDQTDGHEHEQVISSSARLAKRKGTTSVWEFIRECREEFQEGWEAARKKLEGRRGIPYESRGAKELISQGLLILERLTHDEENCMEISRHQRLLSKITSPLSSHDFLSNARDKTMVEMLNMSLTVVSRLLSSPGDGATRLRQELASNTEAISNLMAILEPDREGAQELREQALDILTELAFDYSFKQLDFKRLLKTLIQIFEKEANNNNTAGDVAYGTKADVADRTIAELAQADREYKATRLRWKSGEALARLLSIRAVTDVNVSDKLSKQEAIDLLSKVLDQILSCKMGKTADAIKMIVIKKKNQVFEEHDQILSSKMGTNADAAKKALTKIENLSTESLGKILPSKMKTTAFVASLLRTLIRGIEKQSEEIKSMEAMLSLTVAICNGDFISREDFARATPADEMLAKKLKEILNVNKHCTAESLKVMKLTCQVMVSMIRVKPSCIQRFNEHNYEETLAETLKTMSEVDDCVLFTAGNDREAVVKPARSLASLVKEAQELLETE